MKKLMILSILLLLCFGCEEKYSKETSSENMDTQLVEKNSSENISEKAEEASWVYYPDNNQNISWFTNQSAEKIANMKIYKLGEEYILSIKENTKMDIIGQDPSSEEECIANDRTEWEFIMEEAQMDENGNSSCFIWVKFPLKTKIKSLENQQFWYQYFVVREANGNMYAELVRNTCVDMI